jgi:hypothetical protein
MGGKIPEPIVTNKGIRQGCGLSPLLFNIFVNKVVQEWKYMTGGIHLLNTHTQNTIQNGGDHLLVSTSKDE